VSQKEQLKYILASSILALIFTDPILSVGAEYSYLDTTSSFIILLLTITGLLFCYRNNANADNKDFILRLVTLGLPITIRFVVIIFPIGVLVGAMEAALDSTYDLETQNTKTTLYQIILLTASLLAYFAYFSSIFKRFTVAKNA